MGIDDGELFSIGGEVVLLLFWMNFSLASLNFPNQRCFRISSFLFHVTSFFLLLNLFGIFAGSHAPTANNAAALESVSIVADDDELRMTMIWQLLYVVWFLCSLARIQQLCVE